MQAPQDINNKINAVHKSEGCLVCNYDNVKRNNNK